MADVIKKTTNKFLKGLVMDFSPENTRNEVLTHALNATLLTFNGNELSLQNDMGNGRVETAYLPDGYMPVGTCEYGGIIYIVSYNPLENKSQIGCFPSPERNVSNEELGIPKSKISREHFQKFDNGVPTGDIKNVTQHVLLKSDNLNPGDKFLICANNSIYNEKLANLWVDRDSKYYQDEIDPNNFELVSNPIIALNVVSIEESGRIVYLNSDIRQYDVPITYTLNNKEYTDIFRYPILGKMMPDTSQVAKEDIDSYRNVLSSGYSVFKSKTSGKLAILAELLTIDSYSVTHSIQPRKAYDEQGNEYTIEGSFDIIIHTEITPEITPSNYNLAPKLQYYHLKYSQGYLQIEKDGTVFNQPLFIEKVDENSNKPIVTRNINSSFLDTSLLDVYVPITTEKSEFDQTVSQTGQFNFPKIDTYHGRMQEANTSDDLFNGSVSNRIYTKFTEGKYHRIKKSQVYTTDIEFKKYYIEDLQAKFYKYNPDKKGYTPVDKNTTLEESYTYYVSSIDYLYHDAERNIKFQTDEITLYKYASEPQLATKEEITNKLIEKFQEQEIHRYIIVDPSEYDKYDKLFVKNGDSYEELMEEPVEGNTYYRLETETALVSIGYDVDINKVKDDVFFYPSKKDFIPATEEDLAIYWNFEEYPRQDVAPWGCPEMLYWKEKVNGYRPATDKEILNYKDSDIVLYYISEYIYVDDLSLFNDSQYQLFIVVPMDTFVSNNKFQPDPTINYIMGYEKPTSPHESHPEFPKEGFPKDDPISLYTMSDFIPEKFKVNDETVIKQYEDLKLANIKIPRIISSNGLDLPFKYDYTLVPCMNFGRLDHLAVSNTVDFSKLHAFNQSDFSTWKYHIDGNQLRLTFGANIYDTYEDYKVDALVLEFYDVWGFAGSLEISDKKSYSGIFTKILPLNSLGALSKNRIEGNTYSDKYRRNINIREYTPKVAQTEGNTSEYNIEEHTSNESRLGVSTKKVYAFRDKPIQWSGFSTGWRYTDNSELDDSDNDCGILYSNVVYGVRAYLRRTKDSGYEFIPKKEFFLYTLPIYNDYYYSINDFSTLENPKLDLMLTYKMQDKSSKVEYENNTIKSGYSPDDKSRVSEYLRGFLDGISQFDITKYYKYTGTTDLYLEIGLKQDYQSLNLSYSPAINEYFSCTLQLIGDIDRDKSFTVNRDNSTGLSQEQMLGYNDKSIIDLSENKLTFQNNTNKLALVSGKNNAFYQSNFINNAGNKPLKINYNFIVGYPVNISDIKTTEIKTTTVCALCHQDYFGEYNYSDFGIREEIDDKGNSIFMSDTMYYNQGTLDQEVFGLCRQVQTAGTIFEQCMSNYQSIESDSKIIKTAGKLNTGDSLKQVVPYIGKLTFCQPHVHGLSEVNGVNMYYDSTKNRIGLPEEDGKWKVEESNYQYVYTYYDDCYGTIPTLNLTNNPRYNLVLNTKNSINYNSEFISTIKGGDFKAKVKGLNIEHDASKEIEVNMREFIGLSGYELTQFNKKLIQTFKNIYTYNPDYDSLTVNIGKVSVDTKKPYFTSNLISIDSNLQLPENKTFNDFIYIGPMLFSEYLTCLNKYSENFTGNKIQTIDYVEGKPLKSICFAPSLMYCGTPENYYLISELTYNIPEPTELSDELSFKSASSLTVRHENGDIEFINGQLNKKAFYGFNHDAHKLVQLDVSNYSIASNGKLILSNTEYGIETKEFTHTISDVKSMTESGVEFTRDFTDDDGITSQAKLIAKLNVSATGFVYPIAYGTNSIIIAIKRTESNKLNRSVTYKASISGLSQQNGYIYSIENKKIKLKCNGVLLDSDKVSLEAKIDKLPLSMQTYETLSILANQDTSKNITPINSDGSTGSPTSASTYKSANVSRFKINDKVIQPKSYTNTYTEGKIVMDVNEEISSNPELPDISNPDNSGPNTSLPDNGETQQNKYQDDIELIEITFEHISYDLTRKTELRDLSTGVIKTIQTKEYSNISDYTYTVYNKYKNACFKGTSLTINDLIYEPNIEGHRLFVKNNLCTYSDKYRGKIYYRFYNEGNAHESWNYNLDNNKYKNTLFLYTGPCFDPNNLN